MKKLLQNLSHRRALLPAMGLGLAAGGVAAHSLPPLQACLVGWCTLTLVFLALALFYMSRATVAGCRQQAQQLDEGTWPMLLVTLVAVCASVAAILIDLGGQKNAGGWGLALDLGTVVLSWLFVQVLFTEHYAHEYWLEEKGIDWPGIHEGKEAPSFMDFAYVAFTIGTTFQVSDTDITTRKMRRLVLVHGLTAFLFNTVIVALSVNLAASLATH